MCGGIIIQGEIIVGVFKKSSVGLEIDSKEIRAVHVTGKPERPYLCTFARFPLNEGIVKDGKVLKENELGVALSTMWARENIKCRDVILGVNNQDIIVRFANFIKVPKDKLDNLIRFQAQEHIPIPIEEVELDYTVIREESNDEGTFLKILLVAGKKRMLFDFIASFKAAKLNIVDIGASMLSVTRLVPKGIYDLPVAVVNLSNDFGNIIILNNGEIGMARTINYNKDIVSIVKELNENKFEFGYTIENSLLDSICATLADEIRSSVLYYQNQNSNTIFRDIILTGNLARIKNLTERLKQLINANVMIVSQKESGINLTGLNLASYQEPDYAICTNLAIRGLEV